MVGDKSAVAAKVIAIALPCVLVFVFALKRLYASGNTKHNKDTLPLKAFKSVSRATYQPVKRFVLGYIDFLKHTHWLWIGWLVLWAFHLNLVSIVLGFFAYYFYFFGVLRCRVYLYAGVQAVYRLAGHLPTLPVVEHCNNSVAHLQPLEKVNRFEQTAAFRSP